jgi:hypothetical protein
MSRTGIHFTTPVRHADTYAPDRSANARARTKDANIESEIASVAACRSPMTTGVSVDLKHIFSKA